MQITKALLPLPASLLLLIAAFQPSAIATDANQSPAQWPYNLPAHVKYWPEDPPHRRRDLEAIEQNILAGKNPTAIKKMRDDEGEKFFVEYWGFEDTFQSSHFQEEFSSLDESPRLRMVVAEEDSLYANESISLSFRYPFAVHQSEESQGRSAFEALFGRGSDAFTCPAGTLSCASINRPNSCCASDETCFVITDTGLGDVGCCANGATCTGQQISCPTNDQSCPDSSGGGCCIPGFICDGAGCVPSQSVVTVVTTITVSPQSGTTIVIITSTSIQINPLTSSTSTTATVTSLQTTLACSPSYKACPVNQGGGCCLSSRECGATDCPTSSGSGSGLPTTLAFTTATPTVTIPVILSSSNTITPFASTISPVATATTCPIGFYGCSAVHQGGCCRTGRNCDTTDCPATSSTTIISAGETIVVPVGTAASLPSPATSGGNGNCASGWFDCASVLGGGCCPSGFSCGTVSCSSFSGVATVETIPKATVVISSGVGRSRRIGMKGWLGGVVAVCWVGGLAMVLGMLWF